MLNPTGAVWGIGGGVAVVDGGFGGADRAGTLIGFTMPWLKSRVVVVVGLFGRARAIELDGTSLVAPGGKGRFDVIGVAFVTGGAFGVFGGIMRDVAGIGGGGVGVTFCLVGMIGAAFGAWGGAMVGWSTVGVNTGAIAGIGGGAGAVGGGRLALIRLIVPLPGGSGGGAVFGAAPGRAGGGAAVPGPANLGGGGRFGGGGRGGPGRFGLSCCSYAACCCCCCCCCVVPNGSFHSISGYDSGSSSITSLVGCIISGGSS